MKYSTCLCATALVTLSTLAAAQAYPSRPVRLVITYLPGGTTDFVGRPVAQKLSEILGQTVVVDNRGGAGGVLATVLVAQAPPDGYTLLLGTSAGMVINPLLQSKPSYDPLPRLRAHQPHQHQPAGAGRERRAAGQQR